MTQTSFVFIGPAKPTLSSRTKCEAIFFSLSVFSYPSFCLLFYKERAKTNITKCEERMNSFMECRPHRNATVACRLTSDKHGNQKVRWAHHFTLQWNHQYSGSVQLQEHCKQLKIRGMLWNWKYFVIIIITRVIADLVIIIITGNIAPLISNSGRIWDSYASLSIPEVTWVTSGTEIGSRCVWHYAATPRYAAGSYTPVYESTAYLVKPTIDERGQACSLWLQNIQKEHFLERATKI
jgi:hypothetical protein